MRTCPKGLRMRSVIDSGLRLRSPHGFTLVELLIAMALTLMLVYAVAQFYAYVGETVRDGRAQIEMGNSLRQAASRLQQDFAELTVRVGGRIDSGSGGGVLEIVEGIASDSDPTGSLAVNAQGIPTASIADVNGDGKPDGAMMGDMDDILVMTIRSQGDPFVGRWWGPIPGTNPVQYTYHNVRSDLAEVIWFTTFKDTNGNGSWSADEPRYLVRRQLLIRPDLAVSWPNAPTALPGHESIYHHNDVSCHVVLNSMGVFSGYVANSLNDLSQRENRCIHQNLNNLDLNGLRLAQQFMPNTLQLDVASTKIPSNPIPPPGSVSLYSLDGILQFHGEDKMLSNLMAFDVRVYDPYAPLWADNLNTNANNTALGVLSPGDPGYAFAVFNAISNNVNNNMGSGAYVDLWYNRGFANLPPAMKSIVLRNSNSAYSWAPQARNFPGATVAVWETWTTSYEKDGLDQFGDSQTDLMVDGLDNPPGNGGVDDPSEAETTPPYPVYIGNNGRDDDGQNGVDDPTERDTNIYPIPIPTMLRGIEVRIRMYEPGTRQTRQVTVATDFIPE